MPRNENHGGSVRGQRDHDGRGAAGAEVVDEEFERADADAREDGRLGIADAEEREEDGGDREDDARGTRAGPDQWRLPWFLCVLHHRTMNRRRTSVALVTVTDDHIRVRRGALAWLQSNSIAGGSNGGISCPGAAAFHQLVSGHVVRGADHQRALSDRALSQPASLDSAIDNQIELETLVHTFRETEVNEKQKEGLQHARAALLSAQKSVEELGYRRRGLLVALAIIIAVLIALAVKIRTI